MGLVVLMRYSIVVVPGFPWALLTATYMTTPTLVFMIVGGRYTVLGLQGVSLGVS